MSSATKRKRRPATAEHRPATRKRLYRHDTLIAVDLFSGFGGLTQAVAAAGFDVILAANHDSYKVEVHEANHPEAEHWIADLVDEEAGDYHDVRDLPRADLLVAGVSCVNHSLANSQRAYEQQASLFDEPDDEYDQRVTRSEKDRATANCVLHYAAVHHPRMILVECTTQLASWGPLIPGKKKIGDGTVYRWWLKQFDLLGYDHKVLYLNSQFFEVGQSRNRGFWVFWKKEIPAPDLDHKPISWCASCDRHVEARQAWITGVPPSGTVNYGEQYNYRCPSCHSVVIPPFTPSLAAIDLSNLGTRIGDKPVKKHKDGSTGPLALATLARAERCRQKFADFPAVLMPAKANHGTERHPWQPMMTQTSQQEAALLSTAALMAAAGNTFERPGSDCRVRDLSEPLPTQTGTSGMGMVAPPIALAVDNYQGAPRGADEPFPTQAAAETMGVLSARVMPNRTHATSRSVGEPTETVVAGAGSGGLSILSSGVVPFRKHTNPTSHGEAMPTVTADQIPGLVTAAATIKNNGSIGEAKYRAHPVSDPLGAVTAQDGQALLMSGWYKQNGSTGTETAPHPVLDPFGTLTSRDTTALLAAEWQEMLADLPLEDCYFRMLASHEIGRACGFDVTFGDHQGTFKVWGSERDQVDGFGNAVTPAVGMWIADRIRRALHGEAAA